MDVPSACTLVKVNNCESKLVLKSDERTPCKAEPVYPSSTESLDSQQNSGTKENENAGNSLTSHGAMFVPSSRYIVHARFCVVFLPEDVKTVVNFCE